MSRISFGTLHSGLNENVNPKNNQGAFKQQLLIPCDLYIAMSGFKRRLILVRRACEETNIILIFNIINNHSQFYNMCSFLRLPKRMGELVMNPTYFTKGRGHSSKNGN